MAFITKKRLVIFFACMLAVLFGLAAVFMLNSRKSKRILAELPFTVNVAKTVSDDGFLCNRSTSFVPVNLSKYKNKSLALELDIFFNGNIDGLKNADSKIELYSGTDGAGWSAEDFQWQNGKWVRITLPLSDAEAIGSEINLKRIDSVKFYVLNMADGIGNEAEIKVTNVRFVDISKPDASDDLGGTLFASAPQEDWKLVNSNSKYPTGDLIVTRYDLSEEVNLDLYNGTNLDMTSVIQNLLDKLGPQTDAYFKNQPNDVGGTLYIPEGIYTIRGTLIIPYGVTICGDWRAPADGSMKLEGTILKAYSGRGSVGSQNDAFIKMCPNSQVRNISIWYPEQNPESIVPYPVSIQMYKPGTWGADYTHVRNVTFVNSYNAIVQGPGGNGCPNVHNIYGTPLSEGVLMDGIGDVGRFDYIYFSPEYWENSGLPGAPTSNASKQALRDYLYNNAVAVNLRRIDWSYLCFFKATGYKIGLHFTASLNNESVGGYSNGQCYSLVFKDCRNAIIIEGSSNAGELISDVEIDNCYNGIISTVSSRLGNLQFSFIQINAINIAVLHEGPHRMMFTKSVIEKGKVMSSGALSMTGCDFNNGSPQITLNSGGAGVILIGSRVAGEYIRPAIDNLGNAPVEIDTAKVTIEAPDLLKDSQASERTAKPAREALYVGSFENTGAEDITAALQALLNQAEDEGGGIVFLPPGKYRLNGSITVPTGVELKGSVDTGRIPIQLGTIFHVYAGKNNSSAENAAVKLQKESGIRGIVFSYPEQHIYDVSTNQLTIYEYPYSVLGMGKNVYIVNISMQNTYNGVDLSIYKCDNHYVQYLAGMAIKNMIRTGNGSVDGVISNFQMNVGAVGYGYETKYGSWPNTYPNTTQYPTQKDDFWAALVDSYLMDNLTCLEVGHVENQIIYNNFAWAGRYGIIYKGENGKAARGYSVGNAIDAAIYPIYIEALDDMDIINTQIVCLTKNAANTGNNGFLNTTSAFTGTVRLFNVSCWGSGGYTFVAADGGTIKVYNNVYTPGVRGNTIITAAGSSSRAELYNGVLTQGTINAVPNAALTNGTSRITVKGFYYTASSVGQTNRVIWSNNLRYSYTAPSDKESDPQKFLGSVINNLHNNAIVTNTNSPVENGYGVYIEKAAPASFAAKLGLQQDDVIVLFSGKAVVNSKQFTQMLGEMNAGEKVILKVWRKTRYIKVEFTVGPDNNAYYTPSVVRVENNEQRNGNMSINLNSGRDGGYNTGNVQNGDWLHFKLYFTEAPSILKYFMTTDANSNMTFRLGSPTGPVMFTAAYTTTGGWSSWTDRTSTLSGVSAANIPLNELVDVYVVFSSSINLNWFSFQQNGAPVTPDGYGSGDPDFKEQINPEYPKVSSIKLSPATLSFTGGKVTSVITGENLDFSAGLSVTVVSSAGGVLPKADVENLIVNSAVSASVEATIPHNTTSAEICYTFIISSGRDVLRSACIIVPPSGNP